jgi:hypothetical protein
MRLWWRYYITAVAFAAGLVLGFWMPPSIPLVPGLVRIDFV